MQILWCWRCKMEVPMLDEEEYAEALRLYGEGMGNIHRVAPLRERQKPLLDFYKKVTGWDETVPNAVMHHRIALYGSPCENCGKPYRTPKASFCAACGHRKEAGS